MPVADVGADLLAATDPGPGDLRAPVEFGAGWLVLGVVLLVLAAALVVRAFRRPRRPAPGTAGEPAAPPSPGRSETLAALDVLEREARAGRLSARDVGHRTAELLRAAGTTAATDCVPACRPWQFQPHPPPDTGPLLRAARTALEQEEQP